jgi:heme-degrading monooxygenase HmoA
MFCRIGRVSFSPERADDLIANVRDNVIPMYEGQDGYRGFRLVVDRQNGTALGVTYWDTEEQLHATDDISSRARSGAADASGGRDEGPEVFEIVIDES